MRTLSGILTFMGSALVSPFLTQECKLIKRTELTTNVANPVILLRFELPPNVALGNNIFAHVSITATINGLRVRRNYTPVSNGTEEGYFEIIVKVYPTSLMPNYLKNLEIGKTVSVSPPRGKFVYDKNQFSHIGIISGGVGIAPFMTLIQHILTETPQTKITLLYANQTENDIIFVNTLREWAQQFPSFSLQLVLSQPGSEWNGTRGYIDEKMIKDFMQVGSDKSLIYLCGPKPMNRAVKKIMAENYHPNFYKV